MAGTLMKFCQRNCSRKTTDVRQILTNLIKRLHTCDLPSLLKVKIEGGEEHYLQWLVVRSRRDPPSAVRRSCGLG